MKKNLITLFALLSLLSVSCQKEDFTEVTPATVGEATNYSLYYTVDGTTHHATFGTNDERFVFIHQLVALTREGHHVVIRNHIARTIATKEKVVFTTSSETEASTWAEKMVKQGYEVEIIHDKENGVYLCTATK